MLNPNLMMPVLAHQPGTGAMAPASSHFAAAADPDEQRRLQHGTGTCQRQNSGRAAPQTGADTPQPTAAQATAIEKEAKRKKMLADLLTATRTATMSAAAAAEAEAADKAMDDHIEAHS